MLIIDHIEGDIVVCETDDKAQIQLDVRDFYENPHEGDCFNILDGKYVFDEDVTKNRRQQIINLQNKLFE